MTLALDPGARFLVNALRAGPRSRAELAELTGWSRNTVTTRLNQLIGDNWVHEAPELQGERGRPSLSYVVNPRAMTVYVATFGWDQLHGAVCGLNGEILAGDVVAFGLGGLTDAIEATVQQLARLRKHPALAGAVVSAATIALPSPVANPLQLPAWSHVAVVPDEFASRLGMPVTLENDANLMALGLRRDYPDTDNFVFVKIATGIGAGIIVDGRLHSGMAGLAGEIGHIPVRSGGDQQCACGNRGCLGEVAAVPAVLRHLSTPTRPVHNLDELHDLITAGDGDAVATLRAAGRDIGEALVGVVTGLAPSLLVLGGRLTQFGDHLTTGVRESLTSYTLPALSSRLPVVTTARHRAAGLRGGADLALDRIFAPAR